MKRTLSFFLVMAIVAEAASQNPFATNAFYDAFRKVYADGQKGFPITKGAWINETGIFYDNYKVTTMLPGADSGRLSLPQVLGYPLVTYYFKPSVTLAEAEKKAANLQAAVKTAWLSPVIAVKKTDTLKNFLFYKTYYFENEDKAKRFESVFETYIVKDKGKYQLALTVNGKSEPPGSKPEGKPRLTEDDLGKKIRDILASMDKFFADEKNVQLSQTQYYTMYESRTLVYGQKCKLKDRKYEISWNFSAGPELLSGPEEAKAIYDKLLAAFSSTGRFSFKPEVKEGSRTSVFASEPVTKQFTSSRYNILLEYYNTPGLASVSFLITRQKF